MISFVHMPFADLERPSLGLGLLKAALARAGIDATVTYANLLFASEAGIPASLLPLRIWHTSLVGEWIFAPAVFPEFSPDDGRYLDECVRPFARFHAPDAKVGLSRAIRAELRRMRALAPGFVDGLARDLLSKRPAAVACSSMFSQQTASLALMKKVRELDPGVATILGGANVEGSMGEEVLSAFSWVDAVSSGEADETIVPLCRGLQSEGREFLAGPLPDGVIAQSSSGAAARNETAPRATVLDLDALPHPDYDDYFAALARMPESERELIRPALPLETSRGCWWGCAHACTFCGLNRGRRAYRFKSPDRALAEMEALVKRYGPRDIAMTDNVAPEAYHSSLLDRLEARGAPFNLYYEVRPGLTRERMKRLGAAGARHIQAGIEALDDDLLDLMDKGVTVLQNIALLKHASEFGIGVGWHLLTGFPGEEDDWYRRTAERLPTIHHLEPPASIHGITLQRFSRYFDEPTLHGLRLRPYNSYGFIYPFAEDAIGRLAYYFRDESWPEFYPEVGRETPGKRLLAAAVEDWRAARLRPDPPRLTMREFGNGDLAVTDTRPLAVSRQVVLEGLAARVVREAVDPIGRTTLAERLGSPGSLEETVAGLVARGLLVEESGSLLSLVTTPTAPRRDRFPGGEVSDEAFRTYLSRLVTRPYRAPSEQD